MKKKCPDCGKDMIQTGASGMGYGTHHCDCSTWVSNISLFSGSAHNNKVIFAHKGKSFCDGERALELIRDSQESPLTN